jgi:hypothetical protein
MGFRLDYKHVALRPSSLPDCLLLIHIWRKQRDDEHEGPSRKRRKVINISKAKGKKTDTTPEAKRNNNPYEPGFIPETSEQADSDNGCCSVCGQRKTPFHINEETDGPLAYLDLSMPSKPA